MNPTALALTGYVLWFLVLISGIAVHRSILTIVSKRAPNSFRTDGTDISDFSARLCRAHANCYEGFPYIGGLLLLALVTQTTDVTNSLALVLLGCRIAQSVVHMISTSVMAVQLRFAFFLAQLVISFYWAVQFLIRFAA